MTAEIRTMLDSDWAEVARIYQQGIDSGTCTFRHKLPTWEDFNKRHSQTCRYVLDDNGVVLGWAALTVFCIDCPYSGVSEVSLYMDEAARGKGLGRVLMEHLLAESENNGFWTVWAQIFTENVPSLKMVRRCGFKEIGVLEKVARDAKGQWHSLVQFERRSKLPEFN